MKTTIVVIGGVAAGMSAASQARRRLPDAEVIVLERGTDVSYGACGMPYNIGDPARPIEDLVVIPAEKFRSERRIDVRLRHEAAALDLEHREVIVRDLGAGREYRQPYDRLVLATGARAIVPPLAGIDREGVFVLRELSDGAAIKRFLETRAPRSAVVIGAGYIGMEMAEVLRGRGLVVTVVEKMDQVVPGFEPAIAKLVHGELERHEVRVETGVEVRAIEGGDGPSTLRVVTSRDTIPADLVLVSVGVRPRVEIAQRAGIAIGPTGAIAVDSGMRTSAPDVFAAGDCAESHHLVSGRPVWIPLGTTANKQGKVAGANAAGADETIPGIVGTAGFRVFDLEVARTGLGLAEARRLERDAVAAVSTHRSRAHAFPGAKTLTTVVVAERGTGRLLGAQMAGGESVAKRVDVFATALHAGMTVEQVESLDLSYAPPFAPVYDPVLIAATVALKELEKPASR